jgi:plasmid stabilization system protein ParE
VRRFELARRAVIDLQEIWDYVSEESFDAADRLLDDFQHAFEQLAGMPNMGHRREDLTARDVLFWPLHSYLVIYESASPLRIVRVIHGKRDVRKLLNER